jgi:cytochrome c oxidase accessory protein FixG
MTPKETTVNNSTEKGRVIIPIVESKDKSPIEPPPGADAEVVSLYQAHQKIYPRSVTGLFSKWRWIMVWVTQIIFYGLPWLEWGQRQAVLFDLGARRFYIFGLVLYPQDFIYLTGILVISAYSLFLFTAVAGRLWCGYACPQTVYTEIFLWLEKLAEGDRAARMRRDTGPWNAEKIGRKAGKHAMWLGVALITGFTFVGYFTPIHQLAGEFVRWELSSWKFSGPFYSFATYGMRLHARAGVQIHVPLCPLSERHVRQGHPDRHLRRGAG